MCLLAACNNSGKDTTDKADSANAANRDTALNNNRPAVDEAGSTFIVKVANSGMAEVEMAKMAQDKGSTPVKNLASMLVHDHSALNDQVKSLAAQKNIVLPDSISSDRRSMIDDLKKKSGKTFDRSFLEMMENGHKNSIDMFQDATSNVTDPDINSLAGKTLPTLRMHLDSVKAVKNIVH